MSVEHPRRATPALELRVPAAILRVWLPGGGPASRDALARLAEKIGPAPGIHRLDSGLFAFTPEPTDAAPIDTALSWAHHLLEAPDSGLAGAKILISPGEVELRDGRAEPITDTFAEDFGLQPPALEGGGVFLTAWAANMLERLYRRSPAESYEAPSGRVLPLEKIGPPQVDEEPWRNPVLLRRRLKAVERPAASAALSRQLGAAVLAVEGTIGCGKTRLVWEELAGRGEAWLWVRAAPGRRRWEPGLARQIVARLAALAAGRTEGGHLADIDLAAHRDDLARLEGSGGVDAALAALDILAAAARRPVFLVADDLEQASERDLELLRALLSGPRLGDSLRLILVGRSGAPPLATLGEPPTVRVPPFDEREMIDFARQLFTGLSVPRSVQDRLLEATRGYPFALEEGMIALAREKSLRRVHGSFFFSGGDAEGYRSSLRLVCHLHAEAGRLGALLPLLLLTLCAKGAPIAEIGATAAILDAGRPTGWAERALGAGLLRRTESPWGPGIEIACPAYAAALAHALPPLSVDRLRRFLGEVLAARSSSGEAHWESYRLLRESPEAVFPLLKASEAAHAPRLPRRELLAALARETRRHRETAGDETIELALLRRLLPLARRDGRLRDFADELVRGFELSATQPAVHLAFAGLKSELEQEEGRYREAEVTIQTALKRARDVDRRRQALLLIRLGRLFLRQERFDEAAELFTNLDRALDAQGLDALAATCRYYLGNIAFHRKRLEEALDHHRAALETRERRGLLRPAGSSLTALGSVSLALGNYLQALEYFERARTLLERNGGEEDISHTLMGIGRALSRLGDHTSATGPLRRALELRAGRDDVAGEAIARLAVAVNHLDLGQPEAALEQARQAHFHLSLLSLSGPLADAEQTLGRIRMSQRQLGPARNRLEAALEAHRRHGDLLAVGFDLAWLLEIDLEEGDEAGARDHASELRDVVGRLRAADLGEQLDFHLFRGLAYLRRKGHKVGDPRTYLVRAYREILRKASHLDREQRHQYLYQLTANRSIVDAATQQGLTDDLSGD